MKDITGKRNLRLVVIRFVESRLNGGRKRRMWECLCDCGKQVVVAGDRFSATKSCGCYRNEKIASLNYKHGEARRTKEHNTWHGMKSRCYNVSDPKYKNYGLRGIGVCERWLNSYEDFLKDMGRAPSKKHSIDRINNNENYSPENCRWATDLQQANNKTINVYLTHNGVTKTLKQWADYLNINYKSFHAQIKYKGKTLSDFL